MKKFFSFFLSFFVVCGAMASPPRIHAAYHFKQFRAHPPIHVFRGASKTPLGMTPDQIKSMYHLPQDGGRGTIVIIGAYDNPTIEMDLQKFSKQFSLPVCTTKNGCFEKHKMSKLVKRNASAEMETSLDVEWAHAIAPRAKILLVEATTLSGANLLQAIDYVATRPDAVAISMSWGGAEFPEETSLDAHFVSASGAPFFAASGDQGSGVSWPAVSPNVIGVGGTSIVTKGRKKSAKETAWIGSGGGLSAYEAQPSFQSEYSIPKSNGMRAVPDVAYDADPHSGFPIVHRNVWRTVGGTSAGAPQWAAIAALGNGASNINFYQDKASTNHAKYFRDISSGSNGNCGYYCDARKHYDFITGLGTPLTVTF